MKRPKFVRVITAPLPRAGTTIEGVRRKDDVLPVGSIVPVEWFQECSDALFAHLINPNGEGGLGVIEACDPQRHEMEMLRDNWPDVFAARDKANSTTVKKSRKVSKKVEEEEGGE